MFGDLVQSFMAGRVVGNDDGHWMICYYMGASGVGDLVLALAVQCTEAGVVTNDAVRLIAFRELRA